MNAIDIARDTNVLAIKIHREGLRREIVFHDIVIIGPRETIPGRAQQYLAVGNR